MKKFLLSACIVCASIFAANAQLIKNDFMAETVLGQGIEKGIYASSAQGESNPIMADQWNLTGKTGNRAGASPEATAALTYPGYIESGASNGIQLARLESGDRMTIYSLKNNNDYAGGAYYIAFMATIEEVGSSNGADFFMLDGNYTANNQRSKILLKNGSDNTKFVFGLSDQNSSPDAASGDYDKGETFLLVLKYDFDNTTGGLKLFVNPDLTKAEPAEATVTSNITGILTSIRGITVRQRATLKAQLGGLRFAQTWEDAIGQTGSSVEANTVDKGNVVSVKYYNLSGLEVNQPEVNSGFYIQKNTYENGSVEVVKGLR